MVTAAILEAGGVPFRIREARRRLFILTTGASNGGPAIIESEGGFVCLIALDDLVEVIVEPLPTLKEVMAGAGVERRARLKVSTRDRSRLLRKTRDENDLASG
jgi:hypothetical protein